MLHHEHAHVRWLTQAELLPPHRSREEGEVGRRVVQHAGESAGAPVELHRAVQPERARVEFEVVQRRDHRRKDAHEEPRDLLHRREGEVIRLMHGFGSGEVRANRRRHHERLAEAGRIAQKHSSENQPEETEVAQALHLPSLVRCLRVAHGLGRAEKVPRIERVENPDESAHCRAPRRPAVLQRPPEGHTAQVAKKERRVADGCEAAAHVADDEDEEDDVKCGDAILVHPNPRADEQHGRAGGADEVRQHRADEQEEAVRERRGLAFHADVNAAAHYEERADERDEADVFVRHVEHPPGRAQHEGVVERREEAEADGDVMIMMLPPMLVEEGPERDGRQQQREGEHHPGCGLGVAPAAASRGTTAANIAVDEAISPPVSGRG